MTLTVLARMTKHTHENRWCLGRKEDQVCHKEWSGEQEDRVPLSCRTARPTGGEKGRVHDNQDSVTGRLP